MSSNVAELLSANQNLSRTKVSLEMRALELEEQKDKWEVEKEELNNSVLNIKHESKVIY